MQTSFANIQTNFKDVGSERRTLHRSQNVMLELGRGITEEEKKRERRREFSRSRPARFKNYLKNLVLAISLGLTVLTTYAVGSTYLNLGTLAAGSTAIAVSSLIAAWLFAHSGNKETIQKFRERSQSLFTSEYQNVTNSEYWFGSQPVQFFFDNDHFMIAGGNQEYHGYIPLTRILSIDTWTDGGFIGEYETPALWLTIEGVSDYWADSNILIPGHFFEDTTLDAHDARSKFERFRELLKQSCPNLRQS